MQNLIITQTPYRISLGGGGTDIPFYAREQGGRLITAAIDQYVTVSAAPRPLDDIILVQTTDVQFAEDIDDIRHALLREAIRYFDIKKSIQLATFTTIPTGIGLGTSSTLMVGLVNTLLTYTDKKKSSMEMARIAHHIEREILEFAGGVQDQYIAALGGLQILTIDRNEKVRAEPLSVKEDKLKTLEHGLILIYTGSSRNSGNITKSQEAQISDKTFRVYDRIKEIGFESVNLLQDADLQGLGEAMDEHWALKKTLSDDISNTSLDELYIELKRLGSPGGKIVGAGGGGFFMMAMPADVETYKSKIKKLGYRILDWKFEFKGTHTVDTNNII